MKKLKNSLMPGFAGMALVFAISSCQKSFDPKTYAPAKPLPTYNGFSNSKDIEPSSLVAYWNFSGSLKDSLSATTGTATGTSFSTGVEGQGLQGALNAYVVSDVPAAVKSLHSFTISTWVKMPQNTTGAVGIVGIAHSQNFWGNFDIFFDNGGTATTGVLKVHVFDKSATTAGSDAWEGGYTVANPWNTWIHIVATYDDAASTVVVYYNGAVAGTNTAAGFAPLDWSAAQKMVFGSLQFQPNPSLTSAVNNDPNSPNYYGGWASYMTGVMDQVRVYNKVLSSAEISALYNLEKTGR
jgi:hypothetical protein